MKHEPVLLQQVVSFAEPAEPSGVIVDGTVGLGGHTEALLERYERARVIGIDRDPAAIERSRSRLAAFGDRVTLIEGRHEQLFDILDSLSIDRVDVVLADLGVSSMQLDDAERGFSFRADGPLDMRMGSEQRSAEQIINREPESELLRILRQYGEEPQARRIVSEIVRVREREPITTTEQLAEIVRSVKKSRPGQIDPATLTFQAIRIAVNEEIVGIEGFIRSAVSRLRIGGHLLMIAFHSLEDRQVKRTFRRLGGECVCPARLPVCQCGAREIVRVLTKRPVVADQEERDRNPRSRSAKLRVAEKLSELEVDEVP